MKNFKETHPLLLVVFAKTAPFLTLLSANMAGSDLSHRVKKGKEKGKEVWRTSGAVFLAKTTVGRGFLYGLKAGKCRSFIPRSKAH
jgi:hypothetical protein